MLELTTFLLDSSCICVIALDYVLFRRGFSWLSQVFYTLFFCSSIHFCLNHLSVEKHVAWARSAGPWEGGRDQRPSSSPMAPQGYHIVRCWWTVDEAAFQEPLKYDDVNSWVTRRWVFSCFSLQLPSYSGVIPIILDSCGTGLVSWGLLLSRTW